VIPTRPVDTTVLDARTKATHDVAGAVPPRPRLAVVGARAALRELRCAVVPILLAARERGYAAVSGGAMGIDAEVHARALELAMPQLAVLPCGSDRVYPPHHEELVRRVAAAADSGVVFAQPHGTEPTRAMFVSRNAVIVGLVDAVIVVQAQIRSGSATTGSLALRKRLPTGAIVGTPGCADLIARGATALQWNEHEPAVFTERVGAWLDGRATGVCWPESLARLRDAFTRAGGKGMTLDELGGPAMATLLWQAQALGLVGETTPGRFVVVG
jgi:predicted Rossmann fold nucleotide-binding protein DprA/Smf involved in DNA uptake